MGAAYFVWVSISLYHASTMGICARQLCCDSQHLGHHINQKTTYRPRLDLEHIFPYSHHVYQIYKPIPNASQKDKIRMYSDCKSPPDSSGPHNLVKLIDPDAPRHASAPIRLKDHVLEHLLIHVLLQHRGHAPQVCQRYGTLVAGLHAARKQPKGFGQLGLVRRVVAVVELERADGKEGLVGRVPVVLGVQDREELLELGLVGRRDTQGAVVPLCLAPVFCLS